MIVNRDLLKKSLQVKSSNRGITLEKAFPLENNISLLETNYFILKEK
jgi:hypothetical protein